MLHYRRNICTQITPTLPLFRLKTDNHPHSLFPQNCHINPFSILSSLFHNRSNIRKIANRCD